MTTSDEMTRVLFDDTVLEKPDPIALFATWLDQARQSEINDANAMVLATVDEEGMPDCRTMLLNGMGNEGFVFYTNLQSTKGAQLAKSKKVSLLFHWKSLRRQVRVRGHVKQVRDDVADRYFHTRPRGSQIGAHASRQSQPLTDRSELSERVDVLTKKFEGQEVPRPKNWTGFTVLPLSIEFWQDGEFRLHDRVVFMREIIDGPWATKRLNP